MFSVENGRIIVPRIELNVRTTLECGQVFRYRPLSSQPDSTGQAWEIISTDKKCVLIEEGRSVIVHARKQDIPYFIRYFDLETSYAPILREVRTRARNGLTSGGAELVEAALDYGRGLHILRQDHFETLISFIISTNNNIKRIQGIIERICAALGKQCAELPGAADDTFYAFPSAGAMAEKTEDFYRELGCGYRAGWLQAAAKKASGSYLASLSGLPSMELTAALQTFAGIGPKAADCIAIFAYGCYDVFPVDTWIKKLYGDLFTPEPAKNSCTVTPHIIRTNLTGCFGRFAGIAQQFLFYYYRSR
ncbi:8-oxoguanine DNA glycosylase [Spirochaetia bacterium]|nr:8-oxoguanine DNA glycosylase [Spirochaetia bacterium]